MALTRAQLLQGNNANGIVLPGTPQGVTAGAGVTIATNGQLSVDASTVVGLVKLNNPGAFNAYVWPGVDGTSGQFLQTDGSGNLAWADPSGFAVVTVSNITPSPADVGELWYDCNTGTLKVFQNCVSPNGWTSVSQPGLPVLPGNTSAAPPFTGGNGTQATPYDCTVTTASSGSSVFVVNTVTIGGLAPFQFVPIVDLNAITNGGRFTFSNNYADGSGNLTFQTIFKDQPASPPSTSYTAAIKVGYGSVYIDAIVNVVTPLTVTGGTITGPSYVGQQLTYVPGVPSGGSSPYVTTYQWLADGVVIPGATGLTYTVAAGDLGKTITARTNVTDAALQTASGTSNGIGPILANPGTLTVTSPGSISPSSNVSVGATLTYTTGTYSGGIPTVTQSWVWKRGGAPIAGTTNAATYTTVSADAGQAITVTYTVTDSATPTAATASGTTTSVTPTAPFPSGVWNPTPAGGLNTIPGGISATYNGAGPTVSATGCIEISVAGGPYGQGPTPITSGQTLAARWIASSSCGDAATGANLTGTVTDGAYVASYAVSVNRKPTPAIANISDTNIGLGAVTTKATAAIAGLTATAYVTLGTGSTGSSIQISKDNITYVAPPAAPSTSFPINNGDQLYIRQTVGTSTNVGYTAIVAIGDSTGDGGAASTFQTVTYTATTVNSAAFPNTVFTPSTGPNAAPASVNIASDPQLGALKGTATGTWNDGTTTLTGTNILLGVGAAPTLTSITPNNTQTVNFAWDTTYLAGLANGATATGSFTNGTFTNSYSFTVDKSPVWTAPTTVTGVSLNTAVNTGVLTPDSFNCPVTVSFAVPSGPSGATAMTAVSASVNGGPATAITLGTTTITLNPGDTLQVFGTTGGTNNTKYGVNITLGSAAAQDWYVTTTAVTPTVSTPSIQTPSDGAVNQGTGSGITITGSAYVGNNSPGAHGSSDWQVFGNLGSTTVNPETSAITNVNASSSYTWTSQTTPIAGVTYNSLAFGNNLYVAAHSINGSNIVQTSSDGITWTSRSTAGVTGSGNVVYFDGTQFLLGTSNGELYTGNGTSWTQRYNSGTAPWGGGGVYGVAYSGSTYVIVGGTFGGFIATSSSAGSGYVSRTSPFPSVAGQTINDIAYGNNLFVIVGDNNKIASSPDGITWTNRVSPAPSTFFPKTVAYANGLWVIGGADSAAGPLFLTSTDGVNWTTRTVTGGSNTFDVKDVIYANGSWIGVGFNYVWYTSPDGTSWTQNSGGVVGDKSVVYGNGQYVTGGSSSTIATSLGLVTTLTLTDATDLVSMQVGDSVVEVGGGADASGTITAINSGSAPYTLTLSPSTGTWTNGATVKDTSRTITTANAPLVSTNAITGVTQNVAAWTQQTGGEANVYLFRSTFQNNRFFITGNGSDKIWTSTNGTSWTSNPAGYVAAPGAGGVGAISYLNGTYIANATNGVTGGTVTSSNGTSWTFTSSATLPTSVVGEIAYGNGRFIAANAGIFSSTDGTTWTNLSISSNLVRITYANNQFVAVGFSGVIYTSPDGITWTARTSGVSTTLNSVIYANGLYVVSGNSGVILTSPDGITWTSRTSGTTNTLGGLTFGNGLFVTVGSATGEVLTSPDGITWTSQTSGVSATLYGVSFGNGLFVGCGYNTGSSAGQIWTSSSPAPSTTLTILAANTDGFAVGNLISNGVTGASAASGTITAINGTSVTVAPQSANWANGQKLYRGETIVNVTNDAVNLTSYTIAKPPLAANTTYQVRVKYNSVNNPPVYSSAFSAWSGFTTGTLIPSANTWTVAPDPTGGEFVFSSIYANSLFVMGTTAGKIISSTDGNTWTVRFSGTVGSSGITNFAYDGTNFYGVSLGGGSPGQSSIIKSNNGLTWTGSQPSTLNASSGAQGIAYGNSVLVAVYGGSGAANTTGAWTSTDGGATWTQRSLNAGGLSMVNVKYINNLFVATGGNTGTGQIISSPDGITWTVRTSSLPQTVTNILHDGTKYVAIGYGGWIGTSTDLVSWTTQTSGTTDFLFGITNRGGRLIVAGYSGIVKTSVDAVTWTSVTVPGSVSTESFRTAVSNSSTYVVGGTTGAIIVSNS